MDAKLQVVTAVQELHGQLKQIKKGSPGAELSVDSSGIDQALNRFVSACWEVVRQSDKKFKGTKPLGWFLKSPEELQDSTDFRPLPAEIECHRTEAEELAMYTDAGSDQHAALVCLALLTVKGRRLLYTSLPCPEAVSVYLSGDNHVYALRAMNLTGRTVQDTFRPACSDMPIIDLCRDKIARPLGVEVDELEADED